MLHDDPTIIIVQLKSFLSALLSV